jgi:hypothetical protein
LGDDCGLRPGHLSTAITRSIGDLFDSGKHSDCTVLYGFLSNWGAGVLLELPTIWIDSKSKRSVDKPSQLARFVFRHVGVLLSKQAGCWIFLIFFEHAGEADTRFRLLRDGLESEHGYEECGQSRLSSLVMEELERSGTRYVNGVLRSILQGWEQNLIELKSQVSKKVKFNGPCC